MPPRALILLSRVYAADRIYTDGRAHFTLMIFDRQNTRLLDTPNMKASYCNSAMNNISREVEYRRAMPAPAPQ